MSEGSPSRIPAAVPALAAFAAVAVAFALALSAGMLHPTALALVTLAGVAAITAAAAPPAPASERSRQVAIGILAVGLAASWGHDLLYLPGVLVEPARLGAFRPLLVASGLLAVSLAWRRVPPWAARARYLALVLAGTALAATVVLASPHPGIDVWQLQQHGAEGLLAGRNPYALLYRNPYGPGTPFLDPSLLTRDGRYVTAFPYMPLVLLADAPGAMLGDVRWTLLLALAASALLLRALGKGSIESELAGAFLLLQPQGFMVLELAWTEPLVLAAMLLLALAVARAGPAPGARAWVLPGLAGALAVSTKQYVALLAVPFLLALPRPGRWRALALAAGGAALLALPFLLAGPSAFLRGVVEFQLRQPFRPDALSWLAAIDSLGGPRLPPWPAFLLAGGVLALSVRGRVTPGRAVLAAAATWITFVASSKQAFANYYWLEVGLLCAAIALGSLERPATPAGTAARSP